MVRRQLGCENFFCYQVNLHSFAGTKFKIVLNYTTVNGTGTGEYSLLIRTVDGIPLGQRFLTEPEQPGTYSVTWEVKAAPDPDCDPTQGPCENWLPGNYTVDVGTRIMHNFCQRD